MTCVGSFWFVPANIRTYSALVADTVDIGGAVGRGDALVSSADPDQFWRNLASRDRAWLRRKGFPVAIAGTNADDFPRGSVRYDPVTGRSEIELDEAIAGADYAAWVIAAFGLQTEATAIYPCSINQRAWPIGPPKPWY